MHCESLETRRMFAFTAVGIGSTIHLTGTSGDDTLYASGTANAVLFDLDGDFVDDVWFDMSYYSSFEVECDDGNDYVSFAYGIVDDVWADGGDGDDTILTADGDDTVYGSADEDYI